MDDSLVSRKKIHAKGLGRIFVSYSRHDDEERRINALISWLEELCSADIEFVLDQRLEYSDDIRDFEQSIIQYSAVMIVGTHKYKEKVVAGSHGVSREFNYIIPLKETKNLSVFPIKLDNSFADCFPDTLHAPLAADFFGITYDPNTLEIPPQIRTRFNTEAKRLSNAIKAHFITNTRRTEEIVSIKKKLFFETKHEALALTDDIFNGIFVRTSFFDAVNNRSAHLFIGRKGSGKSFLTDYFTRNPQIAGTIPINIHLRDFSLLTIYNLKLSSPLTPDIGKIISQTDIFEASWSLTFAISCILHLYVEVRSGKLIYDLHKLNSVFSFLDGLGLGEEIRAGRSLKFLPLRILEWSTEKIFHIVDVGLRTLRGNDYASAMSSISDLKNPVKLIRAAITIPVINEFRNLAKTVSPVFLITIDGFDSEFDKFRKRHARCCI
jgi:hypothetical protein